MERTMMESFCAASNFRGFLKRLDLPSAVRDIAEAIELPNDVRGTLLQSVHSDFGKTSLVKISREERAKHRLSKLEKDVVEALGKISPAISSLIGRKWVVPTDAVKHDRVVIAGKTYSVESATNSMDLVCVHNGAAYVPGRTRDILSIAYPEGADGQVLNVLFIFIIHMQLPISAKVPNPFLQYQEFGANLWSRDCYARPSAVPILPGTRFCHGISRKWDERSTVVKALDRVGVGNIYRFGLTHLPLGD